MSMFPALGAAAVVLALSTVAAADPIVTVSPLSVHPGDAVLITVTATKDLPKGKAGGQPLAFFATKNGFQAVFATALDINEDHILVELSGVPKPLSIAVAAKTFPETKLVVEEDFANPPKEERTKIDADNRAIGESYAKASGAALFAHTFRRPAGTTTSTFGEWRTFNDGHRAQHLGLDVTANEGAKVGAVNDGTVALVLDTFLAGHVVVLSHGGGISSLYFHLSKVSVAEGDTVAQGKEIGRAGHTGRTTGPHLHVSIHVPGGLVDPTAFFKLALAPK